MTLNKQFNFVDKLTKESKNDQRQNLYEHLGIEHLKTKLPKEISGGERQRLAIAKAL